MSSLQVQATPYRFRIVANGVEVHKADALVAADPEELWHEAAMSACEMIREMFGRIQPGLDWRLEVTDRSGKLISRFSFTAEMLK